VRVHAHTSARLFFAPCRLRVHTQARASAANMIKAWLCGQAKVEAVRKAWLGDKPTMPTTEMLSGAARSTSVHAPLRYISQPDAPSGHSAPLRAVLFRAHELVLYDWPMHQSKMELKKNR
jgi:hypothetical protein